MKRSSTSNITREFQIKAMRQLLECTKSKTLTTLHVGKDVEQQEINSLVAKANGRQFGIFLRR